MRYIFLISRRKHMLWVLMFSLRNKKNVNFGQVKLTKFDFNYEIQNYIKYFTPLSFSFNANLKKKNRASAQRVMNTPG